MKLIITCLLSILFIKECKSNQLKNNADLEATEMIESRESQELPIVSYTTTTRGFYERIWIENDTIHVASDREETQIKSALLDAEQQKALETLMSKISMEDLPEFEAPTDKRHGDAARMASLTCTTESGTYTSQTFDHGQPPSQIEPLVNKLLSLRDMVKD